MSIPARVASASLIAAAALMGSSYLFAAFAYDDVPGVGYEDPVFVTPPPEPVYEPVRPAARVYGYGPVRSTGRVYAYRPVGRVDAIEPDPPAALRRDRRPLGTYAPSEPTDLSPSRGYFLGVERESGGD